MADDLRVRRGVVIPGAELVLSFTTAQGPGGQNVNRVQTRAELRWDLTATTALPPEALERLRELAGRRLTRDGVLVLTAQRHRTQARNVADVRSRLSDLVRQALARPTQRVATRPSRGARRRRLDAKRRQSDKKRSRGWSRGGGEE